MKGLQSQPEKIKVHRRRLIFEEPKGKAQSVCVCVFGCTLLLTSTPFLSNFVMGFRFCSFVSSRTGLVHGETGELFVQDLVGPALATRVRKSLLRQVCVCIVGVRSSFQGASRTSSGKVGLCLETICWLVLCSGGRLKVCLFPRRV